MKRPSLPPTNSRPAVIALLALALIPASAGAWVFGNGISLSRKESLSGNGRYVAFESDASNLVPGDTNGKRDVFVLDTQTGAVVRASVDSSGNQGNASSIAPALNDDGTVVAFQSDATNLVPGDTNGVTDIFVRDLTAGTTRRVSLSSTGSQTGGPSLFPSISGDGKRVVFYSDSSSLVTGDTNGASDVFMHDLLTQTTRRVSVDSSGAQGNGGSHAGTISADGSRIAFASAAANLVPGDTNGLTDVFLHDLNTSVTQRVSVNSAGEESSGGPCSLPGINADGTRVVFEAAATNLVADDTNGQSDVFIHDLATSTTTRVSVSSAGTQATGGSSTDCSLNDDGSRVIFASTASNLVAGDTNNQADIFVRNLQTGSTVRVNVDSSGNQADLAPSGLPSLNAEGTRAAFYSWAADLVAGDTNGMSDVFVRDLLSGTTSVPVRLSRISVE